MPGTTATYNLPSNLLIGYQANANGTGGTNDTSTGNSIYNYVTPIQHQPYWTGASQTIPNVKALPQFLIQLNLSAGNRNRLRLTANQISPVYLLNTNDFLVY